MCILPVTLSQIVNESTSESDWLKLSIFAPKQPEIAADLFLSRLKRGRLSVSARSHHPATAGCFAYIRPHLWPFYFFLFTFLIIKNRGQFLPSVPRKETAMKKQKTKYGFHISEEVSDLIDTHLSVSNCRNRSEYVEEAIRRYAMELDQKTHQNIITSETARVIRDNIKNLENRLAYILFNVAGEQANIGLLLADKLLDLSDEEIRATRNDAYNIVRKRSGFISFIDAMNNARAVAEME